MNTAVQAGFHERRSTKFMAAGSVAEGIAGIGAIVLAIIGLANTLPQIMLPVATIAVGAALFFEGGAITSRLSHLLTEEKTDVAVADLGAGMATEFVGGVAGIVLGVLALIGIVPLTLVSAASIVFGATLLLGSGIAARLNTVWIRETEERAVVGEVARQATVAAAGLQVLMGIAAIVLGILSVIGVFPLVLNLVAMMLLGFSDLLSGTAIMGRISGLSRRAPEEYAR